MAKYDVGDQVRITEDPDILHRVTLRPSDFGSSRPIIRTIEALLHGIYQYKLDIEGWGVDDDQIVGKVGLGEPVGESLPAFKKKVAEVALRVKNEENWCNPSFKETMEELGILELVYPPKPEPSPGSIVRDKASSTAYVRVWHNMRADKKDWMRTGTEARYAWSEIQDDVVVVLDTKGADSYGAMRPFDWGEPDV